MSSAQEKKDEQAIRRLQKIFRNHGIEVRRENLSRGPSFKVRSGECILTGERLVFIDKRLPTDQQLSTLVDYLVSSRLNLSGEEYDSLPSSTRSLVERMASASLSETVDSETRDSGIRDTGTMDSGVADAIGIAAGEPQKTLPSSSEAC